MKKKLLSLTFLALTAGYSLAGEAASAAEVFVRVAPPAPPVYSRGYAPSHRHVWVDGYYSWRHGRYVWVPGYWAVPPRPAAVWVPHRWENRRDGYVFVRGYWR